MQPSEATCAAHPRLEAETELQPLTQRAFRNPFNPSSIKPRADFHAFRPLSPTQADALWTKWFPSAVFPLIALEWPPEAGRWCNSRLPAGQTASRGARKDNY